MSTIAKRAHAALGGSNSHAWLRCPASAHLSAKLKREGSVYSREGTVAHTVAEHRVLTGELGHQIDQTMEVEGFYVQVTREMLDGAEVYARAIEAQRPRQFALEQRVSLNWLWERHGKKAPYDLFGTSDAILYSPERKWFGIVDYKFGKNKVKEEDNSQLLFYALGAFGWLSEELPQQHWRDTSMTIVQPRSSSPVVRTSGMVTLDLLGWAYEVLVPAVEVIASDAGATSFETGNWCYFCSARQAGVCPAWEKKRKLDAASTFASAPVTDIEEMDL